MINGCYQRFTSSRRFLNNYSRVKTVPLTNDSRFYSRAFPLRREKNNEDASKRLWPWSKKKKDDGDKLKIIKPQKTCHETHRQTFHPECKIAIVLGGTTGMGLSAADSLLYHGARVVILADENPEIGEKAARNLCDFYGKNRARYLPCDLRSSCQLEGVFEESICRYKKVDVLFSNLDRNNAKSPVNNWFRAADIAENNDIRLSNTARAINTGMKFMGSSNNDKYDGIIINLASIIGFMGWPEDPTPVYCFNREPVAETTMDLAEIHRLEETRVRIVAMLKSQKPFADVGLPDFPTSNSRICVNHVLPTQYESLSGELRIGKALVYVMSHATTGSTWLLEPDPCPYEIPWQIHFPDRQGDRVDPEIYEKMKQSYKIALEPPATPSITNCPVKCGKETSCKKFWKTRD